MPILRALHLRKALADDRARIARDMHDDLGTLLTLLTINSAPVGRDMEENPETAFQTGSSGLRKSIDHAPSAPSPAPAPRW
jgi:signal transduction histidine kinase